MSGNRIIREAIVEHIVEINQTRLAEMVASFKTLNRANEQLRYTTGVSNFFASQREFDEFRRLINLPAKKLESRQSREWGDFQTPPTLARQVCQYLAQDGVSPTVVVEPTYGQGSFVLAALEAFPTVRLVYGVEIQERYVWHLKIALLIKSLLGRRVSAEIALHQDNIFVHEFPDRVNNAENILVVGNPPWVTSAELGALASRNLPEKQNLKALNGMDALTGKSNFDISEYILLKLLDSFSSCRGTLAMLCKTSAAKNIVEILPKKQYPVSNIRMLGIDSKREFGVTVDACLLVMVLNTSEVERTCQVATVASPKHVTRVFGWIGDKFVSDVEGYRSTAELDGKSVLVWRQGLKHDCSPIMELDASGNELVNGNGQIVELEEEYLYWLLKSSDLRSFETNKLRKKVIVTQSRLGEDTARLQFNAPKLWKYLNKNGKYFEKRRSSIYRDKPRFSIFGVGDYSFKPYKVATSGMYKEPIFALVCPVKGRPMMLDDTCYFLGFDNYLDALFTATLFNSSRVRQFLGSIVFKDAKRPYTKEILMRVDVTSAVLDLSLRALDDVWASIGYKPRVAVSESDLERYKQNFLSGEARQEAFQFASAK